MNLRQLGGLANIAMRPVLIVHGGAGDIPDSGVPGKLVGVKLAASVGYEILARGGSSLDAVEAAVVSMEKDDAFNAGEIIFKTAYRFKGQVTN